MSRTGADRLLLVAALVILLTGCSPDSMKRTAFETLQNIGRMECQKDSSAACPDRERYEVYQKERKRLLGSK